jgi:NAD(P)-binding Rossmann-like domain
MQSKLGEVVSPSPSPRRVKVAVVGSGLAGLTAAYLLSTAHRRIDVQHKDGAVEYEVHVFEKVCVQGGHPVSFFFILSHRVNSESLYLHVLTMCVIRQRR